MVTACLSVPSLQPVLTDPSLPFFHPSTSCPQTLPPFSTTCLSHPSRHLFPQLQLLLWAGCELYSVLEGDDHTHTHTHTHTHNFAVGCCGDFSRHKAAKPRCGFASPPDANVLVAPLYAQNGSESSTLPILRMSDRSLRPPVHVRPITGFVHSNFLVKKNYQK